MSSGSTTLTFTPVAGRVLVGFQSRRDGNGSGALTGWTQRLQKNSPPDGGAIYTRTATGSESSLSGLGDSNTNTIFYVLELPNVLESSIQAVAQTNAQDAGTNFASVTPTAGSHAIILGFSCTRGDNGGTPAQTAGTNFTELAEVNPLSAPSTHPHGFVEYRDVAVASGSYTPTLDAGGTENYWQGNNTYTVSFEEAAAPTGRSQTIVIA